MFRYEYYYQIAASLLSHQHDMDRRGSAGGAARAMGTNDENVTSSLVPRLKRWRSGKEVTSRMQAVKNGEREQCGI